MHLLISCLCNQSTKSKRSKPAVYRVCNENYIPLKRSSFLISAITEVKLKCYLSYFGRRVCSLASEFDGQHSTPLGSSDVPFHFAVSFFRLVLRALRPLTDTPTVCILLHCIPSRLHIARRLCLLT